MLSSSLSRKQLAATLSTKFPTFWKALSAGQVQLAHQEMKRHRLHHNQIVGTNPELEVWLAQHVPLYWQSLVSGEARRAHYYLFKNTKRMQTETAPLQKTTSLHKVCLSTPTAVSRVRNEPLPPSKTSPSSRSALISLERGEKFFVDQYMGHLSATKRAAMCNKLCRRFPLFWEALTAGEVMIAQQLVQQVAETEPTKTREILSKQLPGRFPLFWSALVSGQVRRADGMVNSYTI